MAGLDRRWNRGCAIACPMDAAIPRVWLRPHRNANDEQGAESLVEDDLRWNARVRAAEDDRERLLSIGEIFAMRTTRNGRVTANVGHESLVAFAEPIECLTCGNHSMKSVRQCRRGNQRVVSASRQSSVNRVK